MIITFRGQINNKVNKGSLQKIKTAIIVTLSLSYMTPSLPKEIGTVKIGTILMKFGPPSLPAVVGTYKLKIRCLDFDTLYIG